MLEKKRVKAGKSWGTVLGWGVQRGCSTESDRDWKGTPADRSGWRNQFVRIRWSESRSRWYVVSDAVEVGRQIDTIGRRIECKQIASESTW